MNRYLQFPLLLLSSSPLLAHPGHGTLPSGEVWLVLAPIALIAAAGLLGYRRRPGRKNKGD